MPPRVFKFVMGEYNFDSDWDAFIEKIESMGIQDCIDIYQDAYDRYEKRLTACNLSKKVLCRLGRALFWLRKGGCNAQHPFSDFSYYRVGQCAGIGAGHRLGLLAVYQQGADDLGGSRQWSGAEIGRTGYGPHRTVFQCHNHAVVDHRLGGIDYLAPTPRSCP